MGQSLVPTPQLLWRLWSTLAIRIPVWISSNWPYFIFCLLIVYFYLFFVYFLGMDLVKLTDICGGGTSTEMANQNVLLSNLQKLEDAGKMITGSSRWVTMVIYIQNSSNRKWASWCFDNVVHRWRWHRWVVLETSFHLSFFIYLLVNLILRINFTESYFFANST